jgi:hypothetical protein
MWQKQNPRAILLVLVLLLVTGVLTKVPPHLRHIHHNRTEYYSITIRMCEDCHQKFEFVSHFLHFDMPHFRRIYLDHKAGGYPRMVVRNKAGEIMRVIDIHHMTYLRLRNFITKDLGFKPHTELMHHTEIYK